MERTDELKEQAESKRMENLTRAEQYQVDAMEWIISAMEKESRINRVFLAGVKGIYRVK